ncbi:hypothetical protein [Nocardia sp. NPDC003263]
MQILADTHGTVAHLGRSFCVSTGRLPSSLSGTASRSSGKRANSAGSAIAASSRDSAAPGQMCGP